MKKILIGALLSVFCIQSLSIQSPAFADDDTHLEMANNLVSAMNMVDQIKNTLPLMQNQLLMTLARKYPSADEKTIVEIKKLSNDFILEMVTTAKPQLAQIITENFKEKELVDILAFFNSKPGKIFVQKQPGMSQSMMQWTNTTMMQAMVEIDKKIEKMLNAKKN